MSQIILKNMGRLSETSAGSRWLTATTWSISTSCSGLPWRRVQTSFESKLVHHRCGCYFAREIPEVSFKISMLLSTQNAIQFRMLMNIVKEYIRDDGTTPIYEVNIGNGASPETFMQCADDLRTWNSGHPPDRAPAYQSRSRHARVRLDRQCPKGARQGERHDHQVRVRRHCASVRYHGSILFSDDERDAKAELIGDVIYHKCVRCDLDAKEIMRKGHKALFAKAAYKTE